MLVGVYVSEFACLLIVLSFGLRLVLWFVVYCGSILWTVYLLRLCVCLMLLF